jgi:DNA-binding PadR family transcriptional regulator
MLEDLARQLKKGSTPTLLLSLLKERPMYGYQMGAELSRRSGGRLTASEGSLYPTLHQLEAQGLIEGFWQTPAGGRARRYYRLTPRGRTATRTASADLRRFASTLLTLVPEASR